MWLQPRRLRNESMVNKILSALLTILPVIVNYFFSKSAEKKEEEKVINKQKDVDFQSKVEEVVKKAENEETKDDALRNMRELLSE
jgi:amino acid permease